MTIGVSRKSISAQYHHMETLSALRALCQGNLFVANGFPSQRVSNASFDVSLDVTLIKLLTNS